MMPTFHSSLKAVVLAALIAGGGPLFAQREDNWYGGYSSGFWGVGNSVGIRGSLPGVFGLPGGSSGRPVLNEVFQRLPHVQFFCHRGGAD